MRKTLLTAVAAVALSGVSACGLLRKDWAEDEPVGLSQEEWTDEETFRDGPEHGGAEVDEILEDDDGVF
ncbi:hypothetical protein C882_3515 [Caenispirillum salinarum AK4]|uniref:Lipoprotein n=1 Tax=Caenispirillum salinarum AK4 TaxID=1238182 RepID=K9H3Y5_9PROT|nr:hypothetical protein [Caenispirillum salinarum]EKV31764.1 hypothetical protein C882_3515 [Caenispirillum salinarum AK4]